jgi:L-amino acid N-acyltransferase
MSMIEPDIIVREAIADDLQGILDIYNDAVLTTTASYDYEPRTLEDRLAWFEEHRENNYPIFVATDKDGKILGWTSLSRFHARIGYRFSTENSVYVAAEARGRGIGKLLMPPLIQGARDRGLHTIIALIDAQNDASLRLHASFGFERVGHMKEVGYKFGGWLDVIIMQLLLPQSVSSPE